MAELSEITGKDIIITNTKPTCQDSCWPWGVWLSPRLTKPSVLRMPRTSRWLPTLSKATLLVAAPQDKDIVQGLDNGDKYGDGDDDGDANDDGDEEDGGEVRQRPKPPPHCPHKTPSSPRGRGKGRGRGGIGDTVTCKGECHNLPN